MENVYISAGFLNDIITDIFELSPTHEDYKNIGGIKCDRNIFYFGMIRRNKYLTDNRAMALKALIIKETQNNKNKKDKLFKYFSSYMPNDVIEFMKKNPDDIEGIADLAISKFTAPNDENNIVTLPPTKPIIEDISSLYVKSAKNLNEDTQIAFNLITIIIEKILRYIKKEENLPYITTSIDDEETTGTLKFKKLMPKSIIFTIKQLNIMMTIKDSTNSYKDFINLIFTSISNIIKWFVKEYLDDSLEFTIMHQKAEVKFNHNKYDDKVRIFTVGELEELGWSIEDIANAFLKLSHETIDNLNSENISKPDLLIKKIHSQPHTRRLLLSNKDKPIGCWSFSPLNDETFEKAKLGKLYAHEITPKTMLKLIKGTYNIHFNSICLNKSYQKKFSVFNTLLFSIIDCIEKFAFTKKVFFNEITTQACTEEGISLCNSLGFKYKATHIDGHGDIYHSTLINLIDREIFEDYHLLTKLYKEKFKV